MAGCSTSQIFRTREQVITDHLYLVERMAGGWRDDEAVGVAQLALVEAVDSWRVSDSGLPLQAWCQLCIRNALSHWRARERRRKCAPINEDMTCQDSNHTGGPISTVMNMVQSLSPNTPEGEYARLKWLEKRPDRAIRASMKVSWATFRSISQRAREKARNYLEDLACVC